MTMLAPLPDLIILAGGLGHRLRTVVPSVPKPLAPILGKPFLHWQLDFLAQQGIQRVILALGYKADLIENYFAKHAVNLELIFVKELSPLGTGGAVRQALSHVHSELVYICNGDSFCNWSPQLMWNYFYRKTADLVVLLTPTIVAKNYEFFDLDPQQRILTVRSADSVAEHVLINAGCYLANTELFTNVTPLEASSLEQTLLPNFVKNNSVYAMIEHDPVFDIGTATSYRHADEILLTKFKACGMIAS